jgi:hypothetical protein
VSVGENNWLNAMTPEVAVVQSGTDPTTVITAPVQNISDSGMTPVSLIWVDVLAATVPVSVGEPLASVEA